MRVVVQDTCMDGRRDGQTDGQYAILSLARFTEPLPDNYNFDYPRGSQNVD